MICYQPFANVCDFGFCGDVLPPDGGPLEDLLCCWPSGACTEVFTAEDWLDCGEFGGVSGSCLYGVTNEDGTVDCFDE